MRVRVTSTWRTRVLLLVAILVAGVLALFNVREREKRRAAERPTTHRETDVIEVELRE